MPPAALAPNGTLNNVEVLSAAAVSNSQLGAHVEFYIRPAGARMEQFVVMNAPANLVQSTIIQILTLAAVSRQSGGRMISVSIRYATAAGLKHVTAVLVGGTFTE
jgi:hypothetical protein